METLERIDNARRLWQLFLPHVETPAEIQLWRWANRFPDWMIERAFARTSRKFAPEKGTFAPEHVHRYATGIMLNEERSGL